MVTPTLETAEKPGVRGAFLAVCISSFLLQLYIASLPSVGDSHIYMQWFKALAKEGLAAAYWDKPVADTSSDEAYYPIDYPPVYPYVLSLEGRAIKSFAPSSLSQDSRILFLIKIPLILAGMFVCMLLFFEVKRLSGRRAGMVVATICAFSPPLLFNTAFWGQSDSIFILFVMLSLISFRRSPELGWLFLTVSFLTKPLGYMYVPLIAVATVRYFRWRRLLSGFLISALTTGIVLIPFAVIHRIPDILHSLVFQINAAPYISVNANNLWWLISGGLPWVSATTKIFGTLTYQNIALVLLAVFYAVTLWKYSSSRDEKALYFAAASMAFGFFSICTHMHENHLVQFLPLLSLIWWQNRPLTFFFVAITFTTFVNLLLYDLMFIYLTIPGLFLTLTNSLLNVLLFLYWIFAFYSFRSYDPVLEGETRLLPSGRKLALLIFCFCFAGFLVFLGKTRNFSTEHFLLDNLKSARIQANPSATAVFLLNIDNDFRPALYEHPPAQITYSLSVPERAVLNFGIALNPAVWTPEKGDGVLFEIFAAENGVGAKLFSRYLDPKRNNSDRKWHDETLELSRYRGKNIQLIFKTSGGPAGDTNYDWAVWGDPRIMVK